MKIKYSRNFKIIRESIENHKELNPDLFSDDELKPEVKDKLKEIADKFINNLKENGIKLKVSDIQIVGSNAGYNYTDKSDIDLHIIADLSIYKNSEDLVQKLYDAYRALWNNKYDPTIYGHPVEIYVEPDGNKNESLIEAVSRGVYSLNLGWINKPKYKDEEPDINKINELVADYTAMANTLDNIKKIDDFFDNIYKERQKSLLNDGEWGTMNLVFKELRSKGVLDELRKKKVSLENKEMSLGESKYRIIKRIK